MDLESIRNQIDKAIKQASTRVEAAYAANKIVRHYNRVCESLLGSESKKSGVATGSNKGRATY